MVIERSFGNAKQPRWFNEKKCLLHVPYSNDVGPKMSLRQKLRRFFLRAIEVYSHTISSLGQCASCSPIDNASTIQVSFQQLVAILRSLSRSDDKI